jgi:hypothetical protein
MNLLYTEREGLARPPPALPIALGYGFTFYGYSDILVSMKLLLVKILAGVSLLLMVSCGTVDYAKKYPNMVANADPVSAGAIEAQFERMFSSKLHKTDVEVIFHPRLNAVSLEFKYEFVSYRQFWDAAGRQQFAAALELYKADYEARNLVDRYRRTRAVYGKTKGWVEWEAFKFTATHRAYPTIEFGYRFKSDAPFFTTHMRRTKEEADPSMSSPNGESTQITMYFTRAQADELVRIFDQAYLMGLLNKIGSSLSDVPADIDPYRESQGE